MSVIRKESNEVSFTIQNNAGENRAFFQIRHNETMDYDAFEVFVKNHENGQSVSVLLKNQELINIIDGLAEFLNIL